MEGTDSPSHSRRALATAIVTAIGGTTTLRDLLDEAHRKGGDAAIHPDSLTGISSAEMRLAGFLTPPLLVFDYQNRPSQHHPCAYVSLSAVASALGLAVDSRSRPPER